MCWSTDRHSLHFNFLGATNFLTEQMDYTLCDVPMYYSYTNAWFAKFHYVSYDAMPWVVLELKKKIVKCKRKTKKKWKRRQKYVHNLGYCLFKLACTVDSHYRTKCKWMLTWNFFARVSVFLIQRESPCDKCNKTFLTIECMWSRSNCHRNGKHIIIRCTLMLFTVV